MSNSNGLDRSTGFSIQYRFHGLTQGDLSLAIGPSRRTIHALDFKVPTGNPNP